MKSWTSWPPPSFLLIRNARNIIFKHSDQSFEFPTKSRPATPLVSGSSRQWFRVSFKKYKLRRLRNRFSSLFTLFFSAFLEKTSSNVKKIHFRLKIAFFLSFITSFCSFPDDFMIFCGRHSFWKTFFTPTGPSTTLSWLHWPNQIIGHQIIKFTRLATCNFKRITTTQARLRENRKRCSEIFILRTDWVTKTFEHSAFNRWKLKVEAESLIESVM